MCPWVDRSQYLGFGRNEGSVLGVDERREGIFVIRKLSDEGRVVENDGCLLELMELCCFEVFDEIVGMIVMLLMEEGRGRFGKTWESWPIYILLYMGA